MHSTFSLLFDGIINFSGEDTDQSLSQHMWRVTKNVTNGGSIFEHDLSKEAFKYSISIHH